MSLYPSSSHQLVAAAIAFRRARRKFPKDFGLENAIERASGSAKAETATSREGSSINQARSSSSLVKRACNSRSDRVSRPASVRGRDYPDPYAGENSISCSCCRTRNGEDITVMRDECSGGDAIDTVPSREREEFAASDADRNEFVKPAERDRCDVTSRTTDDEVARTMEWIPLSARATFYRHRKARCPSKPCANLDPVNLLYDASRERNDKVACGDSARDRSKGFASTSCHGASIDLDGDAEEDVVTGDARGHDPGVADVWTKLDTLAPHRKIMDSARRCHCEPHPRQETTLDLSGSSCDYCCDRCHHYRHHRRDCFHRHCCCQRRDNSSTNANGCRVHGGRICDGKAQRDSWRDQTRDDSGRLYARHCYSKDRGIITVAREHNDEMREKDNDNDDEDNDEDDDDELAVINHKDSMCILVEKYKAGRRCRRGRKCGDKARSGDVDTGRDECNKSLSSIEIIDQPQPLESANAVSHEGPNLKHVCRAHCEGCGTAIAKTCTRGCRHAPPEAEFDRSQPPLNCCSTRAACRRTF